MGSIIYGPVSSWRLGRSLGIDMLSGQQKLCSFDCVYCQLGSTGRALTRRNEFVGLDQLEQELKVLPDADIDYATFSGMGEPTLASNLGGAIELVRSHLKVPVAVITNSSLLARQDVRDELAQADVVITKLDETSKPGKVLALADDPELPMKYVTAGQAVPQSLSNRIPPVVINRLPLVTENV